MILQALLCCTAVCLCLMLPAPQRVSPSQQGTYLPVCRCHAGNCLVVCRQLDITLLHSTAQHTRHGMTQPRTVHTAQTLGYNEAVQLQLQLQSACVATHNVLSPSASLFTNENLHNSRANPMRQAESAANQCHSSVSHRRGHLRQCARRRLLCCCCWRFCCFLSCLGSCRCNNLVIIVVDDACKGLCSRCLRLQQLADCDSCCCCCCAQQQLTARCTAADMRTLHA